MLSKDHSLSHLSKSINTRLSRFTDQSTEAVGLEGNKESTQSFSLVSDQMHYLSKTVMIPDWIRNFIFHFLCFQIIVIGFVPQLNSYWKETRARNLSNLVGIIALIQTPALGSTVFTVFLAIDIALILFEVVLSLFVRMVYARRGHVRPSLCYVSRYMSLAMGTVFLQTSAAFCGCFIGHTFSGPASNFALCLGILVVVVVLLVFTRAVCFLIFTHYTVSYGDQLFLVQKADAVARVYASLFVQVFTACLLREDARFDIIVPWVVVVISFVNFWIDLLRSPWGRNEEYQKIVTSWASSWGTALVYAFDRTNKSYDATDIDFWLAMGWVVLCIMIVPLICKLVIRKALKRLDDPEFPHKARSASAAIRDLRIGFRMGHQGTMECVHVRDLFERFPNNQELLLFCSKLALAQTGCPYTLEEIENSLAADHSLSLIKSHFNQGLVRVIPPSDPKQEERYAKHVIRLYKTFIALFEDARTLYDVIIDEMAAIFSKVMTSYEHNYHKALRILFGFMERYPFSPDGDFFLEIFSVMYPKTPEMEQLAKWQSAKPDYVRQHLTFFPRQLPSVVNYPELFRSYTPEYKVRRRNFPAIPPSLQEVDQSRNAVGPYANIVTRWYVVLLLALVFLFPTVAMGLMIAQNDLFVTKTEQLLQGWSLMWRLKKSESFLYPMLFFGPDDPFWMGYAPLRMQFFKDYSANMTDTRAQILSFGYGIGGVLGDIDMDLLGEITNFMNTPVESLGLNMSITQIFLMTTFLGDDVMAEDAVLVADNMTEEEKLTLLNLANTDTNLVVEKLRDLLVRVSPATSDYVYMSTIAFLVISIVLIVLTYVVIVALFLSASSKFDIFFKTLRDTSKAIVASMRQFIRMCQSVMGLTKRRNRGNQYKKGAINFTVLVIIGNLVVGLILIVLCALQYSAANCRVTQVNRLTTLYADYVSGYNNLTTTIREAFLRKFVQKDPQESWEIVHRLFDLYQRNMWETYDQGNPFCRLCSTVDVYHLYTAAGLTYEKLILNYMVLMRFYMLPDSDQDPRAATVFIQTMQIWYLQIVYALSNFANRFTETCASFYERTRNLEIVFIVLYVVFAVVFIWFFVYTAHVVDVPFQNIVQIFSRFPDSALSQDSLKILRQNNWSFTSSGFVFDSAMYDDILERIPDCIIIIDVQGVILLHNIAAQRIININEAVGKRLFDQLIMTLTTIADETEDDASSGEEEVFKPERLESVVNHYMSDDRTSIFSTKLMGMIDNQKSWYSVTILPIYPEASDLMLLHNETADRFALVFRDIGDEIRQQNLVAEETRKHLQIVHQILPTEIATRLLKEQRSISMTVEKVAISFCDIVQFTPWCGSQPAENVVTALNYMFNLFDERCNHYETVTKIKCIGDCYMSAAGIFSSAAGPAVFGVEMVNFCLDLIEAIGVVNEKLGTKLMVRIGVALGGPISAGVMGIHKPVFDIWGEAVNDAQNLESGGCPMKVHINQELRDFINTPDINVEPKGDGTYFCTRAAPAAD